MQKADELGLALLGCVEVKKIEEDRLPQWIANGHHASMEWMKRTTERRLDPCRVLPGAKSMVLVTLNYYQGDPPQEIATDPSRGLIARYAWFPEYHDVLKEKLETLASYIADHASRAFKYLSYVDTGPVLERYWAREAGLGFIGKNSNLIFWKYGSYVFLGELLCTEALPPVTQQSIGGCGTCTRCMKACPTNAIVSPGVVDARMCISYLTIEHKGVIPKQFRTAIGNRIFGCDICQEVCPWNSKAKKIKDLPKPDWDLWAPRLVEAVGYSEEEFKARYANSPVLRSKHAGFIRNVIIALGNWGTKEADEALARARDIHDNPIIQHHIAWAREQCA